MVTQLGTFFTLQELSVSDIAARRGIDNTPDAEAVKNLLDLVHNVLDPLRRAVGKPIVVTSGFRNPTVNRLVGGSSSSDHLKGKASDVHQPGMTVRELMKVVLEQKLPFDQMIDEYGQWVHLSYRAGRNRQQILKARYLNGEPWYAHLDPKLL